jgi:hypothetical protein
MVVYECRNQAQERLVIPRPLRLIAIGQLQRSVRARLRQRDRWRHCQRQCRLRSQARRAIVCATVGWFAVLPIHRCVEARNPRARGRAEEKGQYLDLWTSF